MFFIPMPEVSDKSILTLEPIGFIHTKMKVKFDAPPQPANSLDERNVVELLPGRGFERALKDLNGFDRIWLLWWFDRNKTWRPLVRPPRGDGTRRGVFATRSPHRPNPLGLTSVPLISISGLELYVGNTDLLDGTPILDIKPYVSAVDAFPDSKNGWLSEVEAAHELPPEYTVSFVGLAAEQIAWLMENWKIDFTHKVIELLSRDPSPHRTRRISKQGKGRFRMGCGPWRVLFSVADKQVLVDRIAKGFPLRLLNRDDGFTGLPEREAQLAFEKRWPEET